MKPSKKYIFFLIFFLAAIWVIIYFLLVWHKGTAIGIGNSKLFVEIAKTKGEQQQGLSYRQTLPDNRGMVFDFTNSEPRLYGFWMKEMRFPLDFIWVRNHTIIGVTQNVPVPERGAELSQYFPPSPVNIVIEVNAGWTKNNHIQIGDQVHTNLF